MYGNLMTADAWAQLTELVDGCDVIQIGCGYGHDTARIAQAAKLVLATDQAEALEHTGYPTPAQAMRSVLVWRGVAEKVMTSPMGWETVTDRLVPRSFHVAVVDLSALRNGSVAEVLQRALWAAPIVALYQPVAWNIHDELTRAANGHLVVDHYHGLFLVRERPVPIKTKEED